MKKFINGFMRFFNMPNILDLPMKKTTQLVVNEKECYAEFTAKRASIRIKSRAKSGIMIQSKYKSESILVGINDNYLASVMYRRRSFPIWIVLSFLSCLLGFLVFAEDEDLFVFGLFGWFFCILFIVLFFTSRTARIVFRLADEQDYQILLTSGAVQDNKVMAKFINRILMNSMNYFEEEDHSNEVGEFSTESNPIANLPEHASDDSIYEASTPFQSHVPNVNEEADASDDNGFEWITRNDGDVFFRPIGSGADWTPHKRL